MDFSILCGLFLDYNLYLWTDLILIIMINRRDFLKNASLFTLGGLMAGKVGSADAAKPVTSETMAAKTVGLQIYSLGKELYADVPGGLKKIKQMGYTNLELAGYKEGKIGGVDMMEFKKMVDDAGLKITSSHVNPPVREYTKANRSQISEYWKKTADDHAKLGVKYLIQPGQPSTRSTEETAFVCEIFNEAGKIVKAAGIPFGYHNHEMEFAKVNPGSTEAKLGRRVKGDCIYELFLKNTDPSLVFFEMDVYWAVMGQQDPIEWLKKYPNRIKVLHIKDRAILGESGMMNFENIFRQAYANGIKDYFVGVRRDLRRFGAPVSVRAPRQRVYEIRCARTILAVRVRTDDHRFPFFGQCPQGRDRRAYRPRSCLRGHGSGHRVSPLYLQYHGTHGGDQRGPGAHRAVRHPSGPVAPAPRWGKGRHGSL